MSRRAKTTLRKDSSKKSKREAKEDDIDAQIEKIVELALQSKTLHELQLQLEKNFPKSSVDPEIDWLQMYLETPRFFATGYRLCKTSKRTRHRLGGRPPKPNPACAACGEPLVLFASIDTTDKQLQSEYPLAHLPLYYCCSCPGPVYYQVTKAGKVKSYAVKREPYEEAPFENPPQELSPGYMRLKAIRAELESPIFNAIKQDGFDLLTKSQLAEISAVLGRKPAGRWEMYFSQVGGVPLSFQGDEGKPDICPNIGCRYRRRRRGEYKYRPLAVLDLWSDSFWGIKPLDAVQIVYHICPGCYCISAKYTCT